VDSINFDLLLLPFRLFNVSLKISKSIRRWWQSTAWTNFPVSGFKFALRQVIMNVL